MVRFHAIINVGVKSPSLLRHLSIHLGLSESFPLWFVRFEQVSPGRRRQIIKSLALSARSFVGENPIAFHHFGAVKSRRDINTRARARSEMPGASALYLEIL